jgi:hypothetical protein
MKKLHKIGDEWVLRYAGGLPHPNIKLPDCLHLLAFERLVLLKNQLGQLDRPAFHLLQNINVSVNHIGLELPFEHVIVSHSAPVHTHAAYERDLELAPWGG